MVETRFKSEWENYDLIKLGGFWAIAVGTIVDNIGIRKMRIAKGKVKGKVFRDGKKKIQYELYDKKDPITQVNRINVKTKKEWNKVKKLGDKWILKI